MVTVVAVVAHTVVLVVAVEASVAHSVVRVVATVACVAHEVGRATVAAARVRHVVALLVVTVTADPAVFQVVARVAATCCSVDQLVVPRSLR
jgi:hypothetical protein